MTYGQLIGYKKRNVFLQKSCKKWGRETSPRLLFVFKKSFIWGKSKFQYISIVHNLACNIIKRCRTWDYWSRDMLNFDFLQKGLGIVSPPYFMKDVSRKIFLMLHSINWSNFIDWLPLLLETLCNMCIAVVCQLGSDVVNFEKLDQVIFLHDRKVKTKI